MGSHSSGGVCGATYATYYEPPPPRARSPHPTQVLVEEMRSMQLSLSEQLTRQHQQQQASIKSLQSTLSDFMKSTTLQFESLDTNAHVYNRNVGSMVLHAQETNNTLHAIEDHLELLTSRLNTITGQLDDNEDQLVGPTETEPVPSASLSMQPVPSALLSMQPVPSAPPSQPTSSMDPPGVTSSMDVVSSMDLLPNPNGSNAIVGSTTQGPPGVVPSDIESGVDSHQLSAVTSSQTRLWQPSRRSNPSMPLPLLLTLQTMTTSTNS